MQNLLAGIPLRAIWKAYQSIYRLCLCSWCVLSSRVMRYHTTPHQRQEQKKIPHTFFSLHPSNSFSLYLFLIIEYYFYRKIIHKVKYCMRRERLQHIHTPHATQAAILCNIVAWVVFRAVEYSMCWHKTLSLPATTRNRKWIFHRLCFPFLIFACQTTVFIFQLARKNRKKHKHLKQKWNILKLNKFFKWRCHKFK